MVNGMTFEDIPPALRIKRNWCVHRHDGEKSKVCHAPGGYKMQWSISANWITFEDAKKAYQDGLTLPEGHKRKFDGLGFFLSREKDAVLDIYAVDLDHCIQAGKIDDWAKDILSRLNSYSEISPSGEGIHVFVKGILPEGSKNTNDQMLDKNRVEVFTDKHHITITGNRLTDYPATIEDRSEIIKSIYDEVMEVKAKKKEERKKGKAASKRILYDGKAEAKKKYVAKAIEDELSILSSTSEGDRNNQLNRSAFALGQFVGGHHLGRREAERELKRAARASGMDESKDGIEATIRSGLDDGELSPREIPEQEEPPQTKLPKITITEDPQVKTTLKQVEKAEKESTATTLVKLAMNNSFEAWHTPDGEPYMTVPINSHREHYRISTKSSKMKAWLGRLGRDLMEKTPSVSAIRDAINNLAGIAIYDGKEYQLYVRKAEVGGKIYVDLGDPSWRAVEISEDGWKVVNDCQIHFRRSKNMLPLPIPEQGGEIDDLKPLINAQTDENWTLTLAWLTQAFWCKGPYAHLYLRGPQGTAKSYMMRILKSISDPSAAINRRLPKTERDAAIALGSESIPGFDNLSGIDNGIADLWCVASTGGVSTCRALFTDDEESVIYLKCPIIANGIEDLGQRGDLLDRTIVIDLDPIPETERKTEKEIQKTIEENRAKLFGALLDITVQGLNNIDSVELENPPRMADFSEWAYACLGDAAKKFIEIYTTARTNAALDLADTNRLPSAIYSFVKSKPENAWKGSASLLLAELNNFMHLYPGQEPRDWPDSPDKMGSEVRRYEGALMAKSIITRYSRPGGKKTIAFSYTGTRSTEETPGKSIPNTSCASCTPSKLKVIKEGLKEGYAEEKESQNKNFQNNRGTGAHESVDSDSEKSSGTEEAAQMKKEPSEIDQAIMDQEKADHEREEHFKTPITFTDEEEAILAWAKERLEECQMTVNKFTLHDICRERMNIAPSRCVMWLERCQA
jgi:hypothetical protein